MKKINISQLLNGEYEPEASDKAVPDFAYSPLNLLGQLYTPIIDKQFLNEGHSKPVWPEGKPFAVCLTHDVDAVSEFNIAQNFRSILKLVRSNSERPLSERLRWIIIHKLKIMRGLFGSDDNICKFEQWMEIEERVGARSTFFFAPEKVEHPHSSDCMYKYSQLTPYKGQKIPVAELMRILDAEGWEIGLHPSWNAHANYNEMKEQKAQIEEQLDHPIESVRQHFLKYDPGQTHLVQHRVGFKYDSTIGFNDNIGFRRGTSYPYKCHFSETDKSESLLQIPLIVQDGALLLSEKGLRLDPDSALDYIKQILGAVKEVGGVLTLSWHPHTIKIPGFLSLYERALELIAKEDPWFGTVAEVGNWWNESVDIDLVEFTSDRIKTKKSI